MTVENTEAIGEELYIPHGKRRMEAAIITKSGKKLGNAISKKSEA